MALCDKVVGLINETLHTNVSSKVSQTKYRRAIKHYE